MTHELTAQHHITAILVAHRDMIEAQQRNDSCAEVAAVQRMGDSRAALLAHLAQRGTSAWVSVDDRQPEEHERVAVLFYPYNNHQNERVIGGATYVSGEFLDDIDGEKLHPPTHWMSVAPLPVAASPQAVQPMPDGVRSPDLSEHYRQAIAQVCEGWTLPEGARKILEAALWSQPGSGVPGAVEGGRQ